MSRMLEACGDIEIVATASNGVDAIAMAATQPIDVIVLDLEMPRLGGLKALPELVAASSGARILIVSSFSNDGAEASIEALLLGATDTLAKPRGGWGRDSHNFSGLLVEKVRTLAECSPIAIRARKQTPIPAQAVPVKRSRTPVTALAIAASTGGPAVLFDLLKRLPPAFTGPVFITQHLPAAFIPHFAAHLERHCRRPVTVACDQQIVQPSMICLAPGHAHLVLVRRGAECMITLSAEAAASGCRPSADPMFESFAEAYQDAGAAIVLSGMGRDGLAGARAVRKAGGQIVVQDQRSSVVWGMPGVIADAGLADAVLAPDAISQWLALAMTAKGRK